MMQLDMAKLEARMLAFACGKPRRTKSKQSRTVLVKPDIWRTLSCGYGSRPMTRQEFNRLYYGTFEEQNDDS